MKEAKLSLLSLLLIFAVMSSCSKEVEDDGGINTSKGTTLSLSNSHINLKSSAGIAHISVKSNTKWTVYVNYSGSSNVTGLNVSPLSGSGNGTIEVKYGAVNTQFYNERNEIHVEYESQGYPASKSVTVVRRKLN